MAELCELAFRQVPRYSSRPDGCFPESSSDGSWPVASTLAAPKRPSLIVSPLQYYRWRIHWRGLKQYGLHYPFWIRDGIGEVKISSVFTCPRSAVCYHFCAREMLAEPIVLNSQYEIEFPSSPGNPHGY